MASFGSSKMNKSSFRLILDSKTTDDKLTTENPLLPAGLSEKKDHPPKILDKILNIATIQGKFFADENGYNSENTHFWPHDSKAKMWFGGLNLFSFFRSIVYNFQKET